VVARIDTDAARIASIGAKGKPGCDMILRGYGKGAKRSRKQERANFGSKEHQPSYLIQSAFQQVRRKQQFTVPSNTKAD
jgi:hypothetical protein